ncbi:tRNA lysidine(34) synthetase TilS [Mucilaginibacter rubeus]|uniref:tRNA(Ile)-lysidine synthase n=1 Tax=Mucilaginibacter rubeus TaxID=2027860 RepID=A0AAE6MKC5_9SPHI|nr:MULTISPECIES: tRNA lysidine(34) synthetase TilS [Mucilaginibacter]QEM06546.1 tRNA lysidine(34) synthetase TilS [Mucilaginibacter rubeus]QEM19135.1 tRNA lysidine(34) synthetase TilS [Mucilaginibacter gossypii]QTE44324.1 tRNA lysidine(34) synthetase TilS [Mucilaginibacter rubeus]QTE50924.1 tRNA lysidine(34) synthetase TilS [Mucilaginibacter rubeus]QTE56007.1 tRNA lysidine(34) synthetase TilS [Mucilaginibacter rubeus]
MLPVNQFVNFIEQNSLFAPAAKILAAVSGGIDSVLMVHLLKATGYDFSIAHCNFQLRGDEALRDQAFCRDLATTLGVPFHTVNFDTEQYAADNKVSIQMAARDLRYQWFETISQQSGYEVVALAHHQNDTIETILLNLTRGTGIAGLHGILPKNGKLVRPLMFLGRVEIQTMVSAEGLSFVEDSSNASAKYARNKIRLEVVPKLKELNPSLEKTFESNLLHFRDLELLLEIRLDELRQTLLQIYDGIIYLSITGVRKLNPKRLLLFKLLNEYCFNEATIDDLIASLDKHSGRIFESGTHTLLLDRDNIILKPKTTVLPAEVIINATDHEANFGVYKLNLLHDDSALIIKNNPLAVSIDADKLVYPLKIRTWYEGDHFFPLGMKGKKKLSDFFINQKVPLHQKEEIPILVNGNGEIMWIGGYRPDERYKVSDNTKKVTIFELFKLT